MRCGGGEKHEGNEIAALGHRGNQCGHSAWSPGFERLRRTLCRLPCSFVGGNRNRVSLEIAQLSAPTLGTGVVIPCPNGSTTPKPVRSGRTASASIRCPRRAFSPRLSYRNPPALADLCVCSAGDVPGRPPSPSSGATAGGRSRCSNDPGSSARRSCEKPATAGSRRGQPDMNARSSMPRSDEFAIIRIRVNNSSAGGQVPAAGGPRRIGDKRADATCSAQPV